MYWRQFGMLDACTNRAPPINDDKYPEGATWKTILEDHITNDLLRAPYSQCIDNWDPSTSYFDLFRVEKKKYPMKNITNVTGRTLARLMDQGKLHLQLYAEDCKASADGSDMTRKFKLQDRWVPKPDTLKDAATNLRIGTREELLHQLSQLFRQWNEDGYTPWVTDHVELMG